jgi:hypothetical protein
LKHSQFFEKKLVFHSYRAILTALFLICFSCAGFAQVQAPSTYSAYTGTDAKPAPPAPALGPANSVFTDPTFGSKILRVTDANTKGGESFVPTDAGFHRTFNADSTAIKLTGPHGDGYWLEFNPSAFSVGDGSSNPVPHQVPFGSTWEWSTVDPNIIYFLNGNQIASYNKATGVKTNLGGPSSGEPVAYAAVVIGQDNWVCSAVGSGGQDTYSKIYCVNPISPGTSKFIDVYNKTINGAKQGDPNWPLSASGQVIGVHDISGGTGANWLEVTFHQQNWGGDGGAVLDLATNTWTEITKADIYWGGHVSMGNGVYANASGSKDGRDSRGILLRNPDNAMDSSQYHFVGQPAVTNNGWCDADHISWLNSMTNPGAPIFVSRYYATAANCGFELTGEIYAAAVDGSGTIWRFAHNHDGGCYYSEGFAQVSNDGKWALFSSYWDGKLGADTSFGCQTRIDTFLIQLTPGDSSSTGAGSGASSGGTTGSSGGTSSGGGTSSSGGSSSSGGTSSGGGTSSSGGTSSGGAASGSVTRYEETSNTVAYVGSWYKNSSANESGGTAVLAMDKGAAATFSFTGVGANWIGYGDQWSGIANVYVDGVAAGQIDTYKSSSVYQVNEYSITGLSAGNHTLKVEAAYAKNSASAGYWVWVDAFEAVSAAASSSSGGSATGSTGSSTPVGSSVISAGGQTMQIGYAEIAGSPNAPAGLAILDSRQNGVLVTEAGVPATTLIQQGRVNVQVAGAMNTGLAVANPSTSPANISFYFTDRSGNQTASGSTTIPAGGQLAKFVSDAPFNAPQSTSGTLTFSSDVPVAATALLGYTNQRNEFLITTVPISDTSSPASGTLYFPHFAWGGGWSTEFDLVNPTDSPISGTLNFFQQGSAGAQTPPMSLSINGQTASSMPYNIPPRSSAQFVTTGQDSNVYVGSVTVTPAQGASPSGNAVFTLTKNGIRISEAGLPLQGLGSAFRMYIESSATIQSAVAVLNTSGSDEQVGFDVTGLDGSSTGLHGTLVVPAGGQRSLFINQIPGLTSLPQPFKGIVRISTPDNGGIVVFGLRGRTNERGEFLLTTTMPTNEADSLKNMIVFPQIVDGGGYTTQFIQYSGAPNEPASGNLQILSQTGSPTPLSLQ